MVKQIFLQALTLPLLADEIHYGRKKLHWTDINNETKENYYTFLDSHIEDFVNDTLDEKLFLEVIPKITVILEFEYRDIEYYLIKDLLSEVKENQKTKAALQYSFFCSDINDLIQRIKSVFNNDGFDDVKNFKQNLLPIELFDYSITIPGRDKKISYETLSKFTYNFLSTDRDNFSSTNSKLGSNNLVKILNKKLSSDDKVKIESHYGEFFENIKSLAKMEEIFNWQDYTDIDNAKEFFNRISILPNMPPMNSLLSSVILGYEDDTLSAQGLGYRNLVLLTVMINSLINNQEKYYSMLSVEEPEAHLSYKNQMILVSYLKAISTNEESVQVFYSTHDVNFINKLDLKNILMFNEGKIVSFKDELSLEDMNYISLNPNLDLFKLFYSNNCILVEGITEELFIKTYLHNLNQMHDIQILSFHKGYTNIMDIWLKLYEGTNTKLGIVRDFDDQPNARTDHHAYNEHENICVQTTESYTLEPEIINTENNFQVLNKYFNKKYGWSLSMSRDELSKKWRDAKSSTMVDLCNAIISGEIKDFKIPRHIRNILQFMGVHIDGGNNES